MSDFLEAADKSSGNDRESAAGTLSPKPGGNKPNLSNCSGLTRPKFRKCSDMDVGMLVTG